MVVLKANPNQPDSEVTLPMLPKDIVIYGCAKTVAEKISAFRATHNDVLVQLVNPFYIMAKPRCVTFIQDSSCRKVSHQQHVAMVKAITERDAWKAIALMTEHIGRVERHFG